MAIFVVAVLPVSLVVVVALSRGLTSAQGLVNDNSACATAFNIIQSPHLHVALSETSWFVAMHLLGGLPWRHESG